MIITRLVGENNGREKVVIWGTGKERREFMHVDDMAESIFHYLNHASPFPFINIGWGEDISIKELALQISNEVGYNGEIVFDTSKPDGMMCKCLDVRKMKASGFAPEISLSQGIKQTINEYEKWKLTEG